MKEFQTVVAEDDEEPPGRGLHRSSAPSPAIRRASNSGDDQHRAPDERRAFRERFFADVKDELWDDWRWQLTHRIRTRSDLQRFLELSGPEIAAMNHAVSRLPFAITPYYLSLVDPNDPADPIRRSVIPTTDELKVFPGDEGDPLGEDGHSPVPGLVHRYPDRVLLLVTQVCATYCRYCTRSRRVGDEGHGAVTGRHSRAAALDYIRAHPEVRDVLLSGGDPLTVTDDELDELLSEIRSIGHVEIIRIGTKAPAVLPMRITPALVSILRKYHPLYMGIHATHPAEVTPEMVRACGMLADAGIPLGSQTVLLKGINDTVETMKALMHRLLVARVRPYYLYQCDPVRGSGHFRTPVSAGLEIIRGLRGHTSGYAVPTYVIDAPGGGGKIPLIPDYFVGRENGNVLLRNYEGRIFRYPDISESEEIL